MRENPKPFEKYQHFKGNRYQILALAKDSENGNSMVVYQALYGDYTVYVRELSQFMSPVDHTKYPEITQKYRFEKCEVDASVSDIPEAVQQPATEQISGIPEEAAAEQTEEQTEEQAYLDPVVVAFLDADSYAEKLNILAEAHRKITDDMLEIMAVASNVELNEGSTEKKYTELRNCLLTMEKFECDRIR